METRENIKVEKGKKNRIVVKHEQITELSYTEVETRIIELQNTILQLEFHICRLDDEKRKKHQELMQLESLKTGGSADAD